MKKPTKKPARKLRKRGVTVTMSKRRDGSTTIKATSRDGTDLRSVLPGLFR